MGLTDGENRLHGQLIKGERGVNLRKLFEHYEKIVKKQPWLKVNNFNLEYDFRRPQKRRFRFMEVATADLSRVDNILLTRVGIHGDERYGVVAFALAFPEVAAYAKEKRVGLMSWVAANPWGLSEWKRYNQEYYSRLKMGAAFDGIDDAIRYQLANGRWVSNLHESRPKNPKWGWADEFVKMPAESQFALDYTRELVNKGMLGDKKPNGGPRIRAVYDGHNDHITENDFEEPDDGLPEKGCYVYSYGHRGCYQKPFKKAEKIVPVIRSKKIDSGDGGHAYVNQYGEAVKYQGAWTELMWRLGAEYVVALETRDGNEVGQDKEIVLVFLKHLIDLAAKG